MMGVEAVVVNGLVKLYGQIAAVDGLSFTVGRGEIFALLGPNGAGKTTTVETLEGYRKPDRGTVRVLGYDPIKQGRRVKQQIGFMPQHTAIYDQIKVCEAVSLFASYYANPRDGAELIERVGLQTHVNAYFSTLSGGQKQRLSLALALVGDPRLVFLDEPSLAMDPQARVQTWDLIRGLREDGITVLLTTHNMEEAERLADRMAIIDRGKLLAVGRPEELIGAPACEVITSPAKLV
jgi:ABC-2 type transport system ATP-binding protein